MGYPAQSVESVYRNDKDDVKRFLDQHHQNNYKLYNLCCEKNRQYQSEIFGGKVELFGFKDHCSPPFQLVVKFCQDMDNYMNNNQNNVAAIHCKAGKGRTGTMICCYLQYSGEFKTAFDSLYYYGKIRTKNAKGVTIPSQIRTVYYFEEYLKKIKEQGNFMKQNKSVFIQKIIILPMSSTYSSLFRQSDYKVTFRLIVKSKMNLQCNYDEKVEDQYEINNYNNSLIELKYENQQVKVTDDFSISLFQDKQLIFTGCFNTHFINPDGKIWTQKQMLDNLQKDKTNKITSEIFQVQIITIDENLYQYQNNKMIGFNQEFKNQKFDFQI